MTGAGKARLAAVVVALFIVLFAAATRLVTDGRAELAASDAAWAKGDAWGAAVHARGAARAYVPGAPHMGLGHQRLRQIAESSERKGDVEAALFAWRATLSADAATRPFSAIGEARGAAEASVARLSATLLASARSSPNARRAPLAETSMAPDSDLRVGFGALLLGGAALFFAAGRRFAFRGRGSDGRIVPAERRRAAALAAAGLLACIAGLLLG
ncbi:MAG TPA: hypothetical protein VK550_03865 [Polyangiaceae bacterium]|nr:hypothetical protein [Polyangiaceae bacterium]